MYQSDGFNQNSPASAGIVAFCGDFSGSLYTRGQLYKLRYDFSPTTSVDVSFLGSYGGYSPQGSAWGASYGPSLVEKCIPGTLECTDPANANLIGKTINALYWFPGTNISNVQQLFSAQLRSSLGNSVTLLARPYVGTIYPETYNGTGEGEYPAYFGPDASYPACVGTTPTQPCYPGAQSLAPGTPIPTAGLPNPNLFEKVSCSPGNIYSFNQINSPQNTVNSAQGQELCYQYPYSTSEVDKLYGTTFSLIRPIGNGFVDFTYDYHGQSTFAYANAPANYQVPPGSATRYSTFSLTGQIKPIDPLAINFGLYQTQWTAAGSTPVLNAAGQAVTDGAGNTITTGLQRSVSRFDPHIAFAYRPTSDWSVRAATGTSETFPFIGDVAGPEAVQPPAFLYTGGIITLKNPQLQPEYSSAYSLGFDRRLPNRSVISLDLQDSTVHNVFQQLATQVTQNGVVLGIFKPINVARLQAKLATLKYVYAPRRGLGFNVAVTADSSILSGIPASAYTGTPSLPANNVQVCGNAAFTPGLATCDPYLKGYGQLTYTFRTGTFVALGLDYEGKNNAYYQPPFAIADLALRVPVSRNFDFNVSVENLLNTNSYNYLPAPNLGVPAVADYQATDGAIAQGSYATYRIPAVTRTLRLSLRAHVGR